MRILVLGGYGLIGLSIVRTLLSENHTVTGLGRSVRKGKALAPKAKWLQADLATLTTPQMWAPIVKDIDIVINASGVLQDGVNDSVGKVQRDAINSCIRACEECGVAKFIQISAPGATIDSDTAFYRTKAEADEALKASTLQWVIFRPGLVLSPYAYGGTSLIRTLAAFPYIQPIVLADAKVQTVFIDDVSKAVSYAIHHDISGEDVDLVSPDPMPLVDIVLAFRAWLGFSRPKSVLRLPYALGNVIAKFADIAGWFGWRSALRSTSLRVLSNNVSGDPKPWLVTAGVEVRSFQDALEATPSTIQERIYARAMLLFPILVLILSFFWLVSGIIGLANYRDAMSVFHANTPGALQKLSVFGGSAIDILIGGCILFRPLTRVASFISVVIAVTYHIASVFFAPHLWGDPLGPMIKVFPVIALGLIVASLAEER